MSSKPLVERAATLLGSCSRVHEPLGAKTTYRVGGTAALYVDIDSEMVLEQVVSVVATTHIDVLTVGNGSNLLIADEGFAGLVLKLSGPFASLHIDPEEGRIVAGASVSYPVLARQSAAASLGGLEWAVGIPGTVGGAVTMNAGGHGAETKSNLQEARIVNLSSGEMAVMAVDDLQCSYRHTNIEAFDLVLDATFLATTKADREKSLECIEQIVSWRREHQPGGRNCGSVFTNPVGDSAGRIIEEAGLKGLRMGSASVSEKHANFIQADADGKAADIRQLIEEVRDLVARRLGIDLVTELRMVGFES